jgi:hypothetical protein
MDIGTGFIGDNGYEYKLPFEEVNIETGTLEGVVNSLFDVFTVSGSQAAKNLGDTLDTEFKKMDPK